MLDLARVVASHPEANAVDLVFLSSGRQVAGVQVMAGAAGAAHGLHDLPQPLEQDVGPSDPFSAIGRAGDARMTLAVVAFYRELPVVLGFLFPQVAQCLFAERDRMVYRHASDLYFTIDAAGNAELSHPSGVFVRIGENPAHDDLTGRDFDARWAIERNTDRQPHLRVHLPHTDLHADPAGNLTVTHAGNLAVNTGGDAAVVVGGNTSVASGGVASVVAQSVVLDAPETRCTGNLTVTGTLLAAGPLVFAAGITGAGSGGGAIGTITGTLTIVDGDVKADGISLKAHVHALPSGGETATPR